MTRRIEKSVARRVVRPIANALALAALLMVSPLASADQPASTRAPDLPVSPVTLFESAVQIGDHGISNRDPVSLIAAARIIRGIGGTYRAEAVRHGRENPANVKIAASTGSRSTDDLRSPDERFLSEARSLAGNDKTISSLIDRTVASGTRGREEGPGRWQGAVSERGYVELDVTFTGSELAEVVVVGDGESDIDLLILDSSGSVVCKSAREHDRESCRWTPDRADRFTVRVMNYGDVWNFVTVVTN